MSNLTKKFREFDLDPPQPSHEEYQEFARDLCADLEDLEKHFLEVWRISSFVDSSEELLQKLRELDKSGKLALLIRNLHLENCGSHMGRIADFYSKENQALHARILELEGGGESK